MTRREYAVIEKMSHQGSLRHGLVGEVLLDEAINRKQKRLSSWDVTFLCIRAIGTLHSIGLIGVTVFVSITASGVTDLTERLSEICLPPVRVQRLL